MSALPPSDETAAMIMGDRANFVGALIECGLYGTYALSRAFCHKDAR
jgi:hypothetical protein